MAQQEKIRSFKAFKELVDKTDGYPTTLTVEQVVHLAEYDAMVQSLDHIKFFPAHEKPKQLPRRTTLFHIEDKEHASLIAKAIQYPQGALNTYQKDFLSKQDRFTNSLPQKPR